MITAVESANAHSTCWEVAELLRDDEPAARSRRASERLLQLAAGLPQGSHLSLVFAGDGAGAVSIRLHTDLDRADLAHLLDWVGEGVCRWVPFLGCGAHLTPLAEADPANQYVAFDRIEHWTSTGAQLSPTVARLVAQAKTATAPATAA